MGQTEIWQDKAGYSEGHEVIIGNWEQKVAGDRSLHRSFSLSSFELFQKGSARAQLSPAGKVNGDSHSVSQEVFVLECHEVNLFFHPLPRFLSQWDRAICTDQVQSIPLRQQDEKIVSDSSCQVSKLPG